MEAERGSSGWSAGTRLLVRYEDDPGYRHERLVVQRVFNVGGWIVNMPHGDLYFEDYCHWAEALEREGPRYDRVPARVSELGDFLASFGEPIGRIAFGALAIDAREAARQECDAHPERAPAEVAERIRNWNRSLRNAPGLVGAAAGRLRRMVGVGCLAADHPKENVGLTWREVLDARPCLWSPC